MPQGCAGVVFFAIKFAPTGEESRIRWEHHLVSLKCTRVLEAQRGTVRRAVDQARRCLSRDQDRAHGAGVAHQ